MKKLKIKIAHKAGKKARSSSDNKALEGNQGQEVEEDQNDGQGGRHMLEVRQDQEGRQDQERRQGQESYKVKVASKAPKTARAKNA